MEWNERKMSNNKLIKSFDFDSFISFACSTTVDLCTQTHTPHTHTLTHSAARAIIKWAKPRWDEMSWMNANEIPPDWNIWQLIKFTNDRSQVEDRRTSDKKICKLAGGWKFITTFQSNLVNFRYESFDVTIALKSYVHCGMGRESCGKTTHHRIGNRWLKEFRSDFCVNFWIKSRGVHRFIFGKLIQIRNYNYFHHWKLVCP